MRLDEIEWKGGERTDATRWSIIPLLDGCHVKVIVWGSDPGYYSVHKYSTNHDPHGSSDERWLDLDPLTAQAVLFELTK